MMEFKPKKPWKNEIAELTYYERKKQKYEQQQKEEAFLLKLKEEEKRLKRERRWIKKNKVTKSEKPEGTTGFHLEGDEVIWEFDEDAIIEAKKDTFVDFSF